MVTPNKRSIIVPAAPEALNLLLKGMVDQINHEDPDDVLIKAGGLLIELANHQDLAAYRHALWAGAAEVIRSIKQPIAQR